MNKRTKNDPSDAKKQIKTSRTKGYYRFSRDFPGNTDEKGFRENTDSAPVRASGRAKASVAILLALLFCLSFIAVRVCVNISRTPAAALPETESETAAQGGLFDGFCGRYMQMTPLCQDLQGSSVKLKDDGAGVVITDILDHDGLLYYTSAVEAAVVANASRNAPSNADRAVTILHQNGLRAAARISCFCDTLAADYIGGAAVYKTAGSTAIDNIYADAKGKNWLDPYSSAARDYILSIIRETAAMGFDYIVITDVCLPAVSGIYLPDAQTSTVKLNDLLRQFISDCADAAGSSKLILELPLSGISGGKGTVYGDGDLLSTAAQAVAVDLRANAQDEDITVGSQVFSDASQTPFVFVNAAADYLGRKKEETGTQFIAFIGDSATYSQQLEALSSCGIYGYGIFAAD